ncbi:MAG TPA: RNase adapter RapZ [Deltaproteobacteria bacterium]|nr:RNase adapter RapZ [Deltaproteobacteria bacterium]HPP81265.1 RNase adapter RapZ [Deltaproteobacteria bacterium]
MENVLVLMITGLSGSGKTTALKVIEDEGFFCMDNVPVELVDKFLELFESASPNMHKLCICTDMRSGDPSFADKAPGVIRRLRSCMQNVRVIFLESSKENLLNRYKETRRRHPLSDRYPSLIDAIEAEMELMAPLRGLADFIVNTSQLNVHELSARIKEIISMEDKARDMHIEVSSFAFKRGLPLESDIVIDVRFLPNPYFVPGLKEKTGMDPEVKEYLSSFDTYVNFVGKLKDFIGFILPLCKREGRSYLHIAIGCTGGRHRSVAVAEEVRQAIEAAGFSSRIKHRDVA